MIYENTAGKFGKWCYWFKEYIESEDMNQLFAHIKSRSTSGAKILPASSELFRCFKDTDPDNLKCIIVNHSPYCNTYGKEGDKKVVADGLALSCSNTWKDKGLEPALAAIYLDMEEKFDPEMNMTGDLSYLAEQGVLLYNVALTVEADKSMSMNDAWSSFNKFFFEKVVNVFFRGLPIIFLGNVAAKSANYLTPMLHYPFLLPHPDSASNKGKWSSNGVWQSVNKILAQNNGNQHINWYLKIGDKKVDRTSSYKPENKIDPSKVSDLPFD